MQVELYRSKLEQFSQLFLRLAIATAFFSAVMDRFGMWGPPGSPNASWGDWENFMAYSNAINSFAPPVIGSFLAIVATILEIVLGVMLLVGYKTRLAAFSSGVLLALFGIPMVFAFGIKPTFTYSVWIGAGAALLLASVKVYSWSIDQLMNKEK